jgi:F-type H+-transporting ATPase subunit alpha
LFAANEGFLDDVDVNKVVDFEAALHAFLRASRADLLAKVNADPNWDSETESAFYDTLKEFKENQTW